MKTGNQHAFSRVPEAKIQRSAFDRSHGLKTTFNAGWLIPVFADEALPGDTFKLNMSAFARLATPLKPIMDSMMLDSFFFAVPIRLLWDNWQKMNGEQIDPDDSTDFRVPISTTPAVTGATSLSMSDYLGIPTGVPGLEFTTLFHRAYNLIWNEWFRDQNLQDSVVVNRGNGPDTYTDYNIKRRGKRHDYFTSCLMWPQKGPDIPLPLGSQAPVRGNGLAIELESLNDNHARHLQQPAGDPGVVVDYYSAMTTDTLIFSGTQTGLVADLSDATAATINSLREAFQLQRLYERDARGGTRYTEILRSHFGVISPDARLQRPEYLGGGSSPVNIHPVAQTSSAAVGSPQANLAAFGTSSAQGHGFVKSFTEHCVILGLVCVRADITYQQGLNRMFSRRTRWDFYWPSLAHLGEQAVLNKEIYAQGSVDAEADGEVFGYQERYAEYRYKPSMVTGKFRSSDPQSLDVWHLSQDFSELPELGDDFIQENPPVERVIAVNTEPHFLFDAYFHLKCARPMPVFGVPGLIDHF